jgi:hypothetical protein
MNNSNATNSEKLNAIYKLVLKLNDDVAVLTKSHNKLASEFSAYTKRESDIQEDSSTLFILRELSRYLKQYTCYKSSLKNIYMPNTNDDFTDFDGCIILSKYNFEQDPNNLFNVNTRKQNRTEAKQKLNLTNYPNKENNIAIVVECKHGLTKMDINTKLVQLYTFMHTVENYKNEKIKTQGTNFKKMVEEHDLKNFPNSLYLVFSANDISPLCETYINSINNGLTMKIYDDVVLPEIRRLCKEIILKDKNIPNSFKGKLDNKNNTSNDIYDILETKPQLQEQVFKTILPYKAMVPILNMFINKVGIHRFNEIRIPTIYTTNIVQGLNK